MKFRLGRVDAKIAAMGVLVMITSGGTGAYAQKIVANADKVDGKHAVGPGVTNAQAANKLVTTGNNGKLAAKFLPKVADSETLDGLDSTNFLRADGTAKNAETLDGKSPSQFLSSTGTAADSAKLGGAGPQAYVRKCHEGSVLARVHIDGSQVPATGVNQWSSAGVDQNYAYLCTGEQVLARKRGEGNFEVMFGDQLHGQEVGNLGVFPWPVLTANAGSPGVIVDTWGPMQCASNVPPYHLCYSVRLRDHTGAPVNGHFFASLQ